MAIVFGSPIPAYKLSLLDDILTTLQMEWQTRLAVTVFLFYEFFLTLDQEIEHVWKNRWSPSSALYIFVRYFGTLCNLIATVLKIFGRTDKICQFMFGIEFWGSFIIVWTAQVILQMRLYALYHCSKRLLVFMVIFFAAEVGISLWIMVAMSLINHESFVEHISIIGRHHNDIYVCYHRVVPAYAYIWAPWFSFDAILAVLAVWAGIKHSIHKSHSNPARLNRPWLVRVLIQGNVIYFLGPLVGFTLSMIHNTSPEIEGLANTLLLGAPIAISVGCRLILSIREAASPHHLSSVFSRTMSAFIVQDRSWREDTS